MPVYDRTNVPTAVSRGDLDPELKAWLPTGPVLGADIDIAQGRRDHRQLGVGPWPTIGSVDTLVLPGPHGSLAVRRHVPTEATSQPSGALIYIHGGGFTYGTPDEFEVPMRLIAEQAGIRTYVVEYQLAPEAKYPTQLDEIEYVVRWLFDHAAVARARKLAADSERADVASEVQGLVARSGLSKQDFAERIGTSRSRLSTYMSGKVVPSATLMVRMRRVALHASEMTTQAAS